MLTWIGQVPAWLEAHRNALFQPLSVVRAVRAQREAGARASLWRRSCQSGRSAWLRRVRSLDGRTQLLKHEHAQRERQVQFFLGPSPAVTEAFSTHFSKERRGLYRPGEVELLALAL